MDIFSNFSDLFISVWSKGIRGVDIFQILIGIGIFFIFLIFRGIISKVIIKRLEAISKRTTNKLDDTFVHAMEGPARFLPIVLGFFIASYYMSIADDGRAVVDTINRTLITILIFWVIHQIIEPISYILSGLDKMLTRELVGWIIKSLKILICSDFVSSTFITWVFAIFSVSKDSNALAVILRKLPVSEIVIQKSHIILAKNLVFHDFVTPINIERDTEPTEGRNPMTPASRSSPNVGFHPR